MASPFSLISYEYLSPLVWLAYKKSSLEADDLPSLRPDEKAYSIKDKALPVSLLLPIARGPTYEMI